MVDIVDETDEVCRKRQQHHLNDGGSTKRSMRCVQPKAVDEW